MPVTIGLVAAGTQGLVGLGQTLFSGRRKAENALNEYAKQSPLARPSKSIDDYYQQALNRYQENPYQSQQYQMAQQAAQRGMSSGLSALQDRRSAIGGIGRLAGVETGALENAGVQAEAQRNARFGQLGGASQMKSAQDKYLFDINQMTPYNRQLQLKQYAAQAANARQAAGLQTMAGGLSNAAAIGAASYGGGSGGGFNSRSGSGSSNPLGIDYTSGISPTQQKLNYFTPGWGQ